MNKDFRPVGTEQMLRVFIHPSPKTLVVNITDILGMVHMIPIARNKYIVNDRIDLTTWNDLS